MAAAKKTSKRACMHFFAGTIPHGLLVCANTSVAELYELRFFEDVLDWIKTLAQG
ncbi:MULTISPECIES: hypothetical protein [Streptomyces]|uniref:hypothetical protein n=1 Tax=Streptomyces TaxID=1883 RepID=UPI001E3F6A66|nr:hypothetical protein [Streptomyces sp. DH20]